MRVGENEVVFKFLITPTPSSNNDKLIFINHTNHYVSRSSKNKSPPSKNPKNLKDEEKSISPKPRRRVC